MPPSLPELQQRFAASLADSEGAPESIAVYRNTMRANYRNALAATYRVVRELVGAPFFNAAADAYAVAHPSTGGDLNVYGGEFAGFLATYPHARELSYLPDVARLEWALDDATRAADARGTPAETLALLGTVASHDVVHVRFVLDPSCRLVRSDHPVMRIWQVHQHGHDGDVRVDLSADGDRLLVRRESHVPTIERLPASDFAWLAALAEGTDLAGALDAALVVDETFDLGSALRAYIADGTITAVAASAHRDIAAG